MTPRRWGGAGLQARTVSLSMRVPQELVEYYQCHSLKESFKQLDTTLKYPYKSRERVASRASSRSPGNACLDVSAPSCVPPPRPSLLACL